MKIYGAILDRVHKTLDKNIWDIETYPPALHEKVKKEVLEKLFNGLKRYDFRNFNLWIKNIFLIGSMTTLQYRDTSDLDITLMVDEKKLIEENKHKKEPFEDLKKFIKSISGDFFDKTLHKINYYVKSTKEKLIADGIYEIVEEKWIKYFPELPFDFDPDEVFTEYKEKALEIMRWIDLMVMDINRSVIDLRFLQEELAFIDKEQQQEILNKIREKINKIEEEIFALTEIYSELHKARDKAFALDEIDEKGFLAYKFSRNWLPPNIVYKFLERYNYLSLLHELKKVIKEGVLDIDKLNDVLVKKIHIE